jgi:teichuronopeptide biosynthesis TupA-like protein
MAQISGRAEAIALPPPSLTDVRRMCTSYRKAFGRYPNLLRPRRYTEKLQWRKLFDLNPAFSVVSDKIAMRDFVTACIGGEFLPPLLWQGDNADDIPFSSLAPPYILKCNHASGPDFRAIVETPAGLDTAKVRARLRAGLARNFGRETRQPGYAPIRPRLLAERLMLEPDGTPPAEHKVFVFNGRARFIQTVTVTADRGRFDSFHDRDWRPLPWTGINPRLGRPLERPQLFDELLALSERLGAGLDHVRVDFYVWRGRPAVGEMTLYNWNGLRSFDPPESDVILGGWWTLPKPLRRALKSLLLAS